MIKKHYYTLRKYREGDIEAIILEDEPVFLTRHNSFKRARQLASALPKGLGYSILVRRVAYQDDMCTEWKFDPSIKR